MKEPNKKIYIPPKLIEYGHVSKLTQGGATSSQSDSGNNMMMP